MCYHGLCACLYTLIEPPYALQGHFSLYIATITIIVIQQGPKTLTVEVLAWDACGGFPDHVSYSLDFPKKGIYYTGDGIEAISGFIKGDARSLGLGFILRWGSCALKLMS